MPSGLLTLGAGWRYAGGMDGTLSLLSLALSDRELLANLADLTILAAVVMLAIFSALVLVRQVMFAIAASD